MSAADKLREARALIERGWCQKEYARRANGSPCWPLDDDAETFCIIGAVLKVSGCRWLSDLSPYLKMFEPSLSPMTRLCDWQDEPARTQAEVLAAFDRAIELAEQQP